MWAKTPHKQFCGGKKRLLSQVCRNYRFRNEAEDDLHTTFINKPDRCIQGHDIGEWKVRVQIRPWKCSSGQERFLAEISRPSIQWKSFCKKVQTDRFIVRYRNYIVNECSYYSSVGHRRRCSRGRVDMIAHSKKRRWRKRRRVKNGKLWLRHQKVLRFPRQRNCTNPIPWTRQLVRII